jgi:hypothetical protein
MGYKVFLLASIPFQLTTSKFHLNLRFISFNFIHILTTISALPFYSMPCLFKNIFLNFFLTAKTSCPSPSSGILARWGVRAGS